MNFEPENYSKYTLRRLAALLDVICWVLIAVVTVVSACLLNGGQHEQRNQTNQQGEI
ncbi:hypothetical protein ACOI9Q_27870 [Klebsiella sp. C228]|uniref:hypothetical protein n=1 Tax=Klebsiella sp. C228 TaxID=3409926 RepID=UPI003B638D72